MGGQQNNNREILAFRVNVERCNGCVVCSQACPTRAIRVIDGRAVIMANRCVQCGECVRVCSREAMEAMVSVYTDMGHFEVTALMPSSMLYTQFGARVLPNDVLLALAGLGFDHVYDPGVFCEMVNLAIDHWLQARPHVRPAISPACPVVVKLIASRFPNLIRHLVPVTPPREAAAKYIRRTLAARLKLEPDRIGVFHVTPCAAKLGARSGSGRRRQTRLSGVLGVNDIYRDLFQAIKRLPDEESDEMLFRSSGLGIGWDMSGGEVAGLRKNQTTLCVSGLTETIQVLEHLEAGRLRDVTYIECRTCPDGCLGGPLAVENRYRARTTLATLVKMFGTLPHIRHRHVDNLIEEGFFIPDLSIEPIHYPLDPDPLKAIAKRKQVDELTERLPGRLCGGCGAPDCRTLAEDVVQGRAGPEACPWYDDAAREDAGE